MKSPYTVYILANDADESIYIGITWHWHNRQIQHKRQLWWHEVTRIDRIEVPDEYTARIMEKVLIESRLPLFNRRGRTLPLPWVGPPESFPRITVPPYRYPLHVVDRMLAARKEA